MCPTQRDFSVPASQRKSAGCRKSSDGLVMGSPFLRAPAIDNRGGGTWVLRKIQEVWLGWCCTHYELTIVFFFLFFFFHFPTLAGGATESPFRKPQPDFTISHLTTTSIFSIAELEITIWVGKCSVTERERSVNEVTPVFS